MRPLVVFDYHIRLANKKVVGSNLIYLLLYIKKNILFRNNKIKKTIIVEFVIFLFFYSLVDRHLTAISPDVK